MRAMESREKEKNIRLFEGECIQIRWRNCELQNNLISFATTREQRTAKEVDGLHIRPYSQEHREQSAN